MRSLRHAVVLLFCLAASGLSHAACENGLAERMHAKLYPQRPLDERLAACKPWPAYPGRSIVVLPMPHETSDTGARVYDLELLLIQRPDNGNTERDSVIGRLFLPEALEEDRSHAVEDLRIDTSRYVLASSTRAFGLRVRYRDGTAGTAASETLRLYVQQGSRLRQVLQEVELDRESGEWDAAACAGRFEKLRTMLSVGKGTTNGYADLVLSRSLALRRAQPSEDGGCNEKAVPARFSAVTLRYDGERYKVPKALMQPAF